MYVYVRICTYTYVRIYVLPIKATKYVTYSISRVITGSTEDAKSGHYGHEFNFIAVQSGGLYWVH